LSTLLISLTMSKRLQDLTIWLQSLYQNDFSPPQALPGDASFRRYFRINYQGQSQIIMDAPPTHEHVAPFLDIAQRLHSAGLNVPQILAQNEAQGFYVLTDLGTELYLPHLSEERVERLYGDALAALAVMQVCVEQHGLPLYSRELLQFEMGLYPEWLLQRHLGIHLSARESTALKECFAVLTQEALAQPQVFVHRDYHSRNLLLNPYHNPGIIDFQDAVIGALTYDLVSLLRDCYIVWPRTQVEAWVLGYYSLAQQLGLVPNSVSEATFLRWFDLMGIQRHIKVAGIFARLYHRDGKQGYLADIPTTLRYIIDIAKNYPETHFLAQLNHDKVLPAVLAWTQSKE
jgi:N-acetylmuramate 1-kinase